MKKLRMVRQRGAWKYFHGAQEVTRKEFEQLRRERSGPRRSGTPNLSTPKSTTSEGAAVHPKDARAAEEHARRSGVPTEFDKHGRPKFRSLQHQRKYLRLIGMFNKDSYL